LMSLSSLAISFNQTASASSIGSLDPTFGNAGVSTFNVGSSVERASKVLIDSEGRMIVIGTSDDSVVVTRFLSNGAVDTSLGTHGYRAFYGSVVSDAVLTQGKIIISGYQRDINTGLTGLPWLMQLNDEFTLDMNFGDEGRTGIGFAGVSEQFNAVAIQPDGKIVVVGTTNNHFLQQQTFLVTRFNVNGGRDSSFGNNGIIRIDVTSGVDTAHTVKVLSDSKILVAGTVNGTDLGVLRMNANGSLDTSFANNGIHMRSNAGALDVFSDIELDQGLGIVISSGCTDNNQTTFLCVIRLNPDGSVESSFGHSGITTLALEAQVHTTTQVSPVADGKILIAGTSDNDSVVTRLSSSGVVDTSFGSNGTRRFGIDGNSENFGNFAIDSQQGLLIAGTSDDDFVVTRLSSSGVVDTSFGGSGYTLFDLERANDWVGDAVQLVTGHFLMLGTSNDDIAVVRLNPNGIIDSSFGIGGRVILSVTSSSREWGAKLLVQPDGRILIGGTTNAYPVNNIANTDLLIIRLNADGSRDNSFGTNGIRVHELGGRHDDLGAMSLDSSSRILVGAGTGDERGDRDDFMLLRFLGDGNLDTSFGNNGVHTTNIGSLDVVHAISVQDNGKILVGGVTNPNVNFDIALLRLNENGSVDVSFGTNGKMVHDLGNNADEVLAEVVIWAGKIVVLGSTWLNNSNRVLVLRYLVDGAIDTSFNQQGWSIIDAGAWARNMKFETNGNLMVSGSTEGDAGSGSVFIRLTPNGLLDSTFGTNGILVISTPRISGIESIFNQNHAVVFGSVASLESHSDFGAMKVLISQQRLPEVPPPPLVTPTPQSNISAVVKLSPAPSMPTNARATTRNNSIRLSWDIPTFNTSFVVRDSAGVVQCRTISNTCDIQGLKNGKQYNFLLFSVNSAGVESETAAKITAIPGFQVKRSTVKVGRAINLSSILTTPSKGKKTWRVVSGRCSIRGNRLVAASKTGTCGVRLSTAKQGAFGAMSTTVRISIAR